MKQLKFLVVILLVCACLINVENFKVKAEEIAPENKASFIKWVDLNAGYEIIKNVYKLDKELYKKDKKVHFCEIMAFIALKNGNNFNYRNDLKQLSIIKKALNSGEDILEKYADNKYYKYYKESYHAIFDGIIGEYKDEKTGELIYGIKGYFPLAAGFWYNHYDDFGNSRSYGFKRKHLGHDIMGSVGTPIIAVEGGTITEIGWNRYGGWRIGIRSDDTKRYYYYAHLRKDRPFVENLKKGDKVAAGDVIGYLGVTGYSYKENKNMKTKPHLHFGMQLIFDESQVDGNEIWIDVYGICRFLCQNRMNVVKDSETKEYRRNIND